MQNYAKSVATEILRQLGGNRDIRFKVHFYATFWLRSGLNQSAVS